LHCRALNNKCLFSILRVSRKTAYIMIILGGTNTMTNLFIRGKL
jgi:hypothetical protein